MIEPIQRSIKVNVSNDRAFRLFANEMGTWWPQKYTWSGEVLHNIGIEPRENGRCYEQGPLSFECDWGRVLKWMPPTKLVITWQISPDRVPQPNPEHASEIEIDFEAEGPSTTRVDFEHRNFENHGDGAEDYREALAADEGWTYILDCYKKSVNGE